MTTAATHIPSYPARPPFFAMRFIRLMVKSVVASTLGEDVFALLSVIVTTEDARRYKSPVTFFNGQLAPLTGATSWDALNRTRTKATSAGWLIHIPPARGQRLPSTYWVTIPDGLDEIEDGPVDEGLSPEKLSYQRGFEDGRNSVLNEQATTRENAEREHSHSTENTDQTKVETRIKPNSIHGSTALSNAEHSNLSLFPIPNQQTKRKTPASRTDNPPNKKPGSVFSWLNPDDLHDVRKLIAWHKRASKCPNPVIGPTDADRLRVVSAAVHCWDKADDPIKLFAWIVGKGQWQTLHEIDEDTAHRLITDHLRGGPRKPSRENGDCTSTAEAMPDLLSGLGVKP